MELLVIIIFILGIWGIFVLFHLDPLNSDEVNQLALNRRFREISAYYSFDHFERNVDLQFKKRMAANGSFYKLELRLVELPSIAAALLKYKKHEWIIVAFEKDKTIDTLWLNKGVDKTRVSFGLNFSTIAQLAMENSHTSVLVFHNHPNGNPSLYSMSQASDQDKKSARALETILKPINVNLLEFVCERGRHYRYWESVCDSFLPLQTFVINVESENGQSKWNNYKLHYERMFKK